VLVPQGTFGNDARIAKLAVLKFEDKFNTGGDTGEIAISPTFFLFLLYWARITAGVLEQFSTSDHLLVP